MFEIYLILATCFLLPICYLITNNLIYIYHQLKSLKDIEETTNIRCIDNKYILYAAHIYINRKKWLDCITILEFYMKQIRISELTTLVEYYNCIGLCYQYVNIYKTATEYYLKAYNKAPSTKQTLKNLANIYKLSGDIESASKLHQKLTRLNK
ncbi:ycf37 (chloroplast) [Gracilaria domingensis]|uniref:hypothetical protein n=1 Tax=Gracilaria domingensis TaxID=172961 RepID=UPI001D12BDF4|nr:hypothetical protein LK222_pgp175 [Gracilaria domingensis]KAI0556424.1 ycf37 [Gracilaria domingensis]UAD85321.1 hypothetical protein [Gracilaria domingensis]